MSVLALGGRGGTKQERVDTPEGTSVRWKEGSQKEEGENSEDS